MPIIAKLFEFEPFKAFARRVIPITINYYYIKLL